ncbi:hypothetical protein GCM10022281_08950 [Sphingomonas rosea]|uniref:Transglutaminase-like cysteine proteinase BTLCP n=1 Tax=Sphingomonas rosea TaxID=335605 RepID=A0ABP7TUU8_9SPHN
MLVLVSLAVPVSADVAASASAPDAESVTVTAPTRPNLFGTVAIPGPQGRWADKWRKVMGDLAGDRALAALVAPARSMGRLEQLRYLQAQVDHRVGWRSDATQYGARSYWASSSETLASGRGDDDDRAILKFQALRELGYPRNDYYLMMGRDRVRGDYVMLVAKAEGRWWLLEEQGDQPVLAERRSGFEPAASFGAGRAWIHGRPLRLGSATATATGAASIASRARP